MRDAGKSRWPGRLEYQGCTERSAVDKLGKLDWGWGDFSAGRGIWVSLVLGNLGILGGESGHL